MKNECTSCKLTDKIWAVVNKKNNTLHRLTFSKGLAEWLAKKYGDGELTAVRYRYFRTGKIEENCESPSGLYAIVSSNKDIVLRASLFKDSAELLACDDSRHIEGMYLIPIPE